MIRVFCHSKARTRAPPPPNSSSELWVARAGLSAACALGELALNTLVKRNNCVPSFAAKFTKKSITIVSQAAHSPVACRVAPPAPRRPAGCEGPAAGDSSVAQQVPHRVRHHGYPALQRNTAVRRARCPPPCATAQTILFRQESRLSIRSKDTNPLNICLGRSCSRWLLSATLVFFHNFQVRGSEGQICDMQFGTLSVKKSPIFRCVSEILSLVCLCGVHRAPYLLQAQARPCSPKYATFSKAPSNFSQMVDPPCESYLSGTYQEVF